MVQPIVHALELRSHQMKINAMRPTPKNLGNRVTESAEEKSSKLTDLEIDVDMGSDS